MAANSRKRMIGLAYTESQHKRNKARFHETHQSPAYCLKQDVANGMCADHDRDGAKDVSVSAHPLLRR